MKIIHENIIVMLTWEEFKEMVPISKLKDILINAGYSDEDVSCRRNQLLNLILSSYQEQLRNGSKTNEDKRKIMIKMHKEM